MGGKAHNALCQDLSCGNWRQIGLPKVRGRVEKVGEIYPIVDHEQSPGRFRQAGQRLRFVEMRLRPGLFVTVLNNTYSGRQERLAER
jgi:hypothetical protein